MDVRAILLSGEMVLIEMPIARGSAFHKRVTYNMCKAYANQLTSMPLGSSMSPEARYLPGALVALPGRYRALIALLRRHRIRTTRETSTGENYLMLSPVIAVTVTDFILFHKSPKVIHRFQFKDEEDSSE